jgi:hypothetical protein
VNSPVEQESTHRELVLETRGRGWRVASGVLGVLSILSAPVPLLALDVGSASTWVACANALVCGWLFLTVARRGEARIPVPDWLVQIAPVVFWIGVLWLVFDW